MPCRPSFLIFHPCNVVNRKFNHPGNPNCPQYTPRDMYSYIYDQRTNKDWMDITPIEVLSRGTDRESSMRPQRPVALLSGILSLCLNWSLQEWEDRSLVRMTAGIAAFRAKLWPHPSCSESFTWNNLRAQLGWALPSCRWDASLPGTTTPISSFLNLSGIFSLEWELKPIWLGHGELSSFLTGSFLHICLGLRL